MKVSVEVPTTRMSYRTTFYFAPCRARESTVEGEHEDVRVLYTRPTSSILHVHYHLPIIKRDLAVRWLITMCRYQSFNHRSSIQISQPRFINSHIKYLFGINTTTAILSPCGTSLALAYEYPWLAVRKKSTPFSRRTHIWKNVILPHFTTTVHLVGGMVVVFYRTDVPCDNSTIGWDRQQRHISGPRTVRIDHVSLPSTV